jgi:MFS-type transporter involved in bile tolerance (Atg22 family)
MDLSCGDWLKSVCDPIQKSFLRAMENGGVNGRAATLCAIWAAVFHVPLLTALQSALFLEWRSRQERQSLASLTLFFQSCTPSLSHIFHRHLSCHEFSDTPRFAAL